MTDKHPLTDEVIHRELLPIPLPKCFYRENDLRAAADWQLQQVVEWLRSDLDGSCIWAPPGHTVNIESVISDLKKAMRPTTQEDN